MRGLFLAALLYAGPAMAEEPAAPTAPNTAPNAETLESIREFEDQLKQLSPAAKEALELLQKPVVIPDLRIVVMGRQYQWRFSYPRPAPDSAVGDNCIILKTLTVPQGKTVELSVTADDIIHEFAIPGMDLAVDAIPGRLNTASIDTSKTGRFEGHATPMSGDGYRDMGFELRVVAQADSSAWASQNLTADCDRQ